MADRILKRDCGFNNGAFACGLTRQMVLAGVKYLYETLDRLDDTLIRAGSPRMSQLVELANLSSMLGNLFATGIVKNSKGVFERAGPHKYQDLRAAGLRPDHRHIEVKVSLETNNPKAHLAKPGDYLTCRYVLGDEHGNFSNDERGAVVWIWEVRFGRLEIENFNISNSAGDSGKTAVVNASGMEALAVVYADRQFCPHGPRSRYWNTIARSD